MNRLGMGAVNLRRAREMLAGRPGVALTLMTHFADADGERGVAGQLARFRAMAGDWAGPVSLANSAAMLRHPQTHADWVRPGIMLYGSSPFADASAESLGLQPVMTLESAIIGVQEIAAGERVGYGGTFVAATADAHRRRRLRLRRRLSAPRAERHADRGRGQATRTVGRVSMDMLACDLTAIPQAGIGAPVTLWGAGLPATAGR